MAAKFWVGGTGTWDASDTTHWSATSGGAGGDPVPVAGDDITFDGASGGGTVNLAYAPAYTNLSCGAFTGTINFNGYAVTCGTNTNISGTGTRTLNFGGSTFTLNRTSVGDVWTAITTTNLTMTGAPNFIIGNYAFNRVFEGGNLTYGNFSYIGPGSAGQMNIKGSNTWNDFNYYDASNARTLLLVGFTTQTINGAWNVYGSSGKLISITTASNNATISKSSGVVSSDYLNLARSTASGGASFYAGANSTDSGSNIGWTFTAPPVASSGFYKHGSEKRRHINAQ